MLTHRPPFSSKPHLSATDDWELSEIAIDLALGETPNTETAELLTMKAGPFVAQAVGDLGTFDMSRVEYFSSAPNG